MMDYTKLIQHLKALERLPRGWDYGQGGPISRAASGNATTIAWAINGIGVDGFNAMPGHNGSVMVVFYKGTESCEIECLSSDRYQLFFESPNYVDFPVRHGLSFEQLIVALGELGWRSLRLFGSCTRCVMTLSSDVSTRQHSETQLAEESRSFAVTASIKDQIQNVSTSQNSIVHPFPASRQSSGNFQLISWVATESL